MKEEEENVMCFRNYTYCRKVPFAIYADFDSFIVPCPVSYTHLDVYKRQGVDTLWHVFSIFGLRHAQELLGVESRIEN